MQENGAKSLRFPTHCPGMADFKKLRVWKKAHALALCAHEVALSIRGSQYASLRSQIIRSSASIPANIVEGREQKTDPEFCRFLRYALGSTSELEYHMIMANDIKVIKPAQFVEVLTPLKEVRMLLYGLLKCLDPPTSVDREETLLKPQVAKSGQQSAGSR